MPQHTTVKDLAALVEQSHAQHFHKTELSERLRDLGHQVAELVHHRDRAGLVTELGDAGWSLLQLSNELGVDLADAVRATVERLRGTSPGRTVALIGISANPMTNAHLTMGLEVLALTNVDEVWYLLPGQHPWGKKLLSAEHRLEMVRRAVARYPRLKVCDFEVAHAERIYAATRETAPMLRDFLMPAFPSLRFRWVMGSDAAQQFHRWGDHAWMASAMDFIIIHRLGYEFDKEHSVLADPRHVLFKDNVVTSNISSTLVRERGRHYEQEKLVALVPEVVWDYLNEHRLLDDEAFS
jgi:nicotinate-nucleotide adenylyltransferase